jgi:tetratricopeptide (TPR) repeat protein
MRRYSLAAFAGLFVLAAASSGCNKLKARDQLNKGVNSFRNGQFQDAVDKFQHAVTLDPNLVNARLYLAMSYFQQYAPGGDSAANKQMGQQAIAAFENVLSVDPSNTTALATIGTIYYYFKDFDKAKEFQRKRLDIEPNNPEPYYWIGVMDYALAAKNNGDLRAGDPKLAVIGPTGELPPLPTKLRTELADKNSKLIDEGMTALDKAVELKPNYDEAMAYLNLLYRQKADIEATPEERAADIKTANDWLSKAMAARGQAGAATSAASSSSQ